MLLIFVYAIYLREDIKNRECIMFKIFKLKALRRFFSNDWFIDLGTVNTRIYARGQGLIFNGPTVVVINQGTSHYSEKEVLAVGMQAKHMLGRMPVNMKAIRPLKDGVIADFHVTEKMLQHFMHKIHGKRFFKPSPRVLICVPSGSTPMERRAIRESALGAGASSVFLIDAPIAAAIGAGLPISQAHGSMVVDIGGGTTEIAVISLNGIVYANSVRVGGDRFDEAIINHVRRHHGCLIGAATAERIKIEIGMAIPSPEVLEIEIRGRSLTEGIPKTLKLNSNEIRESFQESLMSILNGIRNALEQIPPELSGDIAEKGLVLTGGGSLLKGLDEWITRETGIAVTHSENPLNCVAMGGGMALEMMNSGNKQYIIQHG